MGFYAPYAVQFGIAFGCVLATAPLPLSRHYTTVRQRKMQLSFDANGMTNVVLPTERQRKEKMHAFERCAKAETKSD